jgi:hypothetical protein
MTRIVTSTYRYKRPPREVPAIVTPRKRAVLPTDEPKLPPPAAPPPANDDWPAETAPLPAAREKSAIVTPSKRGRRPKPEPEIDADAEARVQAFLARMVRPHQCVRLEPHHRRNRPLGWEHIALTGDYVWADGERLRPSLAPDAGCSRLAEQTCCHLAKEAARPFQM